MVKQLVNGKENPERQLVIRTEVCGCTSLCHTEQFTDRDAETNSVTVNEGKWGTPNLKVTHTTGSPAYLRR